MGTTTGAMKGDARSSDYGSYWAIAWALHRQNTSLRVGVR